MKSTNTLVGLKIYIANCIRLHQTARMSLASNSFSKIIKALLLLYI